MSDIVIEQSLRSIVKSTIDIIHQLRHKMKIIPGIPIIMEGWKFKPSPQMLATIPILIISV